MFPEMIETIQTKLRHLEQEVSDAKATLREKQAELKAVRKILKLASDDGSSKRARPIRARDVS